MVAIVTGNGFGLERSSRNVLGESGQLGSAFIGRANDGVTVNAATGNLIIQNTDEVLIGRGLDATINRTYNSLGAYAGDTDNWLHNGQRKLTLTGAANAAGSTATLTDWDGSVVTFSFVAGGGYKSTENPYQDDLLTIASNVWTWTEGKSRVVHSFEALTDSTTTWRVKSAADSDGNVVSYTYDIATSAGKLTRVTTANSTAGQTNYTDLVYTGANMTSVVTSYYDLATSTNKTLTRVRYTYDTSNRLATVRVDKTPGDGIDTAANDAFVTTYTYLGTTKNITRIQQSDGTNLEIVYTASKVTRLTQTTASGITRITNIAYDTANRVTTITQTASNDVSISLVSKMSYDSSNRLVKVEEPPAVAGGNAQITDFVYNAQGLLSYTSKYDGAASFAATNFIARDHFEYDANGNLTQRYRWVDGGYLVNRYTYGAKNEVLTVKTFTTLDPDGFGGVDPTGAMTMNFAYDAENHLRFSVSAEGRVTEYRYDLYGNEVSQISYTGNIYSGAYTEAALVAWVAAVATDKTQTQRVDSAYDFRLNVTSITSYSKTDSAGNGLGTEDWSRVDYTYDQFGKLLTKRTSGANAGFVDPPLTTETFVYDGMGRVVSMIDIYGVSSTISINDGTRVTSVTTPNELTKISTYNIAGELISYSEQLPNIIPATYSASSNYNGYTGLAVGGAGMRDGIVDQANSIHGTSNGAGTTITMDFGSTQSVGTVNIAPAVGVHNWSAGYLNGTILERSTDGVTWTAVGTISGAANGRVSQIAVNASARYIRLLSTGNYIAVGDFYAVNSVALPTSPVAGADSGLILATYSASSNYQGYTGIAGDGSGMRDGIYNASNSIHGTNAGAGATITMDLGAVRSVGVVHLAPAVGVHNWSAGYLNGTILERSTDNVTWTTVLTITGAVDGQISQLAVNASTRYLRLRSTGNYIAVGDFYATSAATAISATTGYAYDALGRLRVMTDSVGAKTYYVFDRKSRMTGEIEGDGSLTEYKYDANDRIIATVKYATSVSAASITALGTSTTNTEIATIRPTANVADRWSWNIYDKSGNLLQNIDGMGRIESFRYDAAGRLVESEQHYQAVDSTVLSGTDGLSGYRTSPPTAVYVPSDAPTVDRVVRNFYDNDGFLIGTLDGEGYLTQINYDAAGRKVGTVRLWNQTPTGLWAAGTFAQLWGNTSFNINDVRNYWLYDGRGRVSAVIDGEGNVTRYHYNVRGQVDQEVRGNKVAPNPVSPTLASLSGLLLGGQTLETTNFSYNAAGQMLTQVKFLAGGIETTTFIYDTRGRLLSQTTSETVSTETRTQRFRYDAKGRLIGSLDGVGAATLGAIPTDTQIAAAIDIYGTRYVYDAADQLISKTEPNGTDAIGLRTLYYYDSDGQLRYEINALSEVTEYKFNALEDQTEVVAYGTRIALATLPSLIGGAITAALTTAISGITNALLDSRSQLEYNNAGQVSLFRNPNFQTTPTQDNYGAIAYYNTKDLLIRYSPSGSKGASGPSTANGTTWDQDTNHYDRRGIKNFRWTHIYDAAGVWTTEQLARYTDLDSFGRTSGYRKNLNTAFTEGVRELYLYDRSNRLTQTTDRLGNSSNIAYDSRSNAIAATDRNGKITNFIYDPFNRNVTTTTAEGIVSSIKKNAFGQTILITDGAGRTTSYSYDKDGNLDKVIDAAGTTDNDYDKAGRLEFVTDAKGVKTKFNYDAANRVLSQIQNFVAGGAVTADQNITTTYEYDARGQKIKITDALNVVTNYSYDLKGQNTRVVRDAGAGKLNLTTDFVYGGNGKVVSQTDAVGTTAERTTTWSYDSAGRLTKMVEDAGVGKLNITTLYSYDASDNLVAQTDALNRTTYFAYDLDDRLTLRVDAEGQITNYGYDKEGNVIWTTQYSSKLTSAQLALMPSLTTHKNWLSTTVAINGDLTITKRVLNSSTGVISNSTVAIVANVASDRINRTFYDGDGRAVYALDAEGYVTKNIYDGANNVIKTLRYNAAVSVDNLATKATLDTLVPSGDPASASITTYTYDSANRLTDVTTAFGTPDATTMHFIMDALGQVTEAHVAYGTADLSITKRVFDNVGRVTSETRAFGQSEAATTTYVYNARGEVIKITDALSVITTRTYDNLGRMLSETVPLDATTSAITSYQYDARGNRVKVTDPRNNVGYFYYDNTDRLTLQIDPEGFVTETTYAIGSTVSTVKRYYERASNLASVTATLKPIVPSHAKDATTSFFYDKVDRVLKTTDAENKEEFYSYDASGNRSSLTNKLGGVTTFTFDKNGRLMSETMAATLIAPASIKTYSYDARGNLTSQTSAFGTPEATVTTFAYDKLDRLTSKTDPAILGTTPPPTTYQYDKRGNVILTTAPDQGKTYSYYDDNNRMVAEISPVGTLTAYAYDANGNVTNQKVFAIEVLLASRQIGGTLPQSVTTAAGSARETQFFYDKNNRLTETRIMAVRAGSFNGTSYVTTASTALISINQYDAAGNMVREQDANGNSIYHYYDKNGREIAKVDQEKYLTTWVRDSEGNVTEEMRFATQLVATPSIGVTPTQTFSANDRYTTFQYDKMGRRGIEIRHNLTSSSISTTGAKTDTTASYSQVSYLYNAMGQVSGRHQLLGPGVEESVNYEYDNQGRLLSQRDGNAQDFNSNGTALARRAIFSFYDANNNVVRTEERAEATSGGYASGYSAADNRLTLYKYVGGTLESTTDAGGLTRSFAYDVMGRVARESYSRNAGITEGNATTYDLAGRVTHQQQETYNGAVWTIVGPVTNLVYNQYGEITERKLGGNGQPFATQEQMVYDNAGRVVKTNAGDGAWKFFVYDANGNATLTLASNGKDMATDTVDTVLAHYGPIDGVGVTNVTATITTYSKRNQATGTRESNRQIDAGAAVLITRSQAYNAFGEVSSETDARGFTTDYVYNSMGRLTQKINPLVSVTSESGLASNTRPTESYFYDLAGRLVALQDANGNLTTRTLLANRGYSGTEAKVLKEFRPDGSAQETRYDVFGDARQSIDGLGQTTNMTYDKMGHLTQVTKPSGLAENYVYDKLGQRIGHWNSFFGNAVVETTEYDIQGRVSSTVDFAGHRTNFGYEWNSSLDTSGLEKFGGWILTTSYVDAAKSMTESTNSFGHAIGKTDLGGITTNFSYDKAGRLTAQTSTASPLAQNLTYQWYNTGKIKQIKDNAASSAAYYTSDVTSDFTYDKAGNRLISQYSATSIFNNYDWETGAVYTSTYTNNLENVTATYDAMNRVTAISDPGDASLQRPSFSMAKTYDAVGNVRSSITTHQNIASNQTLAAGTTTDSYWYRYDSLNRIVTTKGQLSGVAGAVGTTIVHGSLGTDLTYDDAGQRATATNRGHGTVTMILVTEFFSGNYVGYFTQEEFDLWVEMNGTSGYSIQFTNTDFYGDQVESYSYNADGYLTGTEIAAPESDGVGGTIIGTLVPRTVSTRDALGRVLTHTEYKPDGYTIAFQRTAAYNNIGQVTSDNTSGTSGASSTTYSYTDATTGLYLNGAVGSQTGTVTSTTGTVTGLSVTNAYIWRDSALLTGITRVQGGAVTTSSLTYDANAHLTSATTTGTGAKTVNYTTDASGQVLVRTQTTTGTANSPRSFSFYLNGHVIGQIGNDGTDNVDYATTIDRNGSVDGTGPFREGSSSGATFADFDQNYTAINTGSTGEAGAGSVYSVRHGDSLQSIALGIWGDASLWYMLAEANGLSASSSLSAGQSLIIPAKVAQFHNNADTFKAYDAGRAIGDVQPGSPLPVASAAQRGRCGIVGQILMVAVAVAVAAYLGPMAIGAAQTAFAGGGAASAAAAATAAASSGTALAASGGLAGGALLAAPVVATTAASAAVAAGSFAAIAGAAVGGAFAGAAGSVASQIFGLATGNQRGGFNFKGVAMAAISGAVGGVMGGGSLTQKGLLSSNVSKATAGRFGKLGLDVARGITANGATQGLALATRLQKDVDWAGLAIGGIVSGSIGITNRTLSHHYVGASANNAASSQLTFGNTANFVVSGMAGAVAGAGARSLITGTSFGDNILAVLPDVIGSTIGNTIGVLAAKLSPAPPEIEPDAPKSATDAYQSSGDTYRAGEFDAMSTGSYGLNNLNGTPLVRMHFKSGADMSNVRYFVQDTEAILIPGDDMSPGSGGPSKSVWSSDPNTEIVVTGYRQQGGGFLDLLSNVGGRITATLSNLLPDKIGVPTPFGTISVPLPLAQGALDWAANTLSTSANSAIKSYNGVRDYIDSITPKSGIGYYAVQIAAAPVDIGAGQLEIFAGGASGMISAAAHPVRTITDAPKAFIMGAAGLVDRALVANDTPLKTHLANGVKAIGNTSIRQGSTAVGRTMGYVALIAAPAKGLGGLGTVTRIEARAANGIGVAAERTAIVSEVAETSASILAKAGRTGKQARLRELAQDTKVSSADRGWIQQEMNSIVRGQRTNIRVPPGNVLAHRRGFEAKNGFSYKYSDLQNVDLHKLQHKYEGY